MKVALEQAGGGGRWCWWPIIASWYNIWDRPIWGGYTWSTQTWTSR